MSLYRRPNGYYAIDIADARAPGGRVAVSARTRKKAEADRRHAAVSVLIERGDTRLLALLKQPKRDGGITAAQVQQALAAGTLDELGRSPGDQAGPAMLGAAIDRLLQTVAATRSAGTLEVYRTVLSVLERKFGVTRDAGRKITADVPIAGITMDQLREWLHERKDTAGGEPWSARRQNLARSLAGKLFRVEIARAEERAERDGGRPELRRNPAAHVEAAKIRPTRVVFLLPAEWRRLIDGARDRPIAAALGLWTLAGLRLMEAAHLRPDLDLVLDGPRPVVRIQSRKGEYPWSPKTHRSERDVPIRPGGELHALLLRHRELGYAGERYFIHPAKEDRPYGPDGLRALAREAFTAAGIKWGGRGDALSVHSLRHTFVSWLVQQDVQAMKIGKLIGDRPEQVYNTYGHLLPQDLEAVAAVIDRVAGQEKSE